MILERSGNTCKEKFPHVKVAKTIEDVLNEPSIELVGRFDARVERGCGGDTKVFHCIAALQCDHYFFSDCRIDSSVNCSVVHAFERIDSLDDGVE